MPKYLVDVRISASYQVEAASPEAAEEAAIDAVHDDIFDGEVDFVDVQDTLLIESDDEEDNDSEDDV